MGSSEKMMLSKDREKGMAANTPGRTNMKNKGPEVCLCSGKQPGGQCGYNRVKGPLEDSKC